MTPHNIPYEKVGKNEPVSIADEVPFEIPESWEWVRLGNIGETNIGLTYKPSDKTDFGGILVLRSSNIQKDKMDYTDTVYVSCDVPERAMIHKGDILICARNGSRALVGKSAIVDKDGMAFGAFMAKYSSNCNEYVKLFIDSPVFRRQLEGVKTETINQITQDMLKSQLCPLPPINEQRRIVKKYLELIPIIDKYNAKETNLKQLNDAFPDILKKSILQEAVMGKLVPQDENDEPASILLERIREEKQRLIAEGKLKKDKHESIIYRRDNSHYEKVDGQEICIDDEIPYDIPDSWSWCRVKNIFSLQAGKNIQASQIHGDTNGHDYLCYGGNGTRGYVDEYNHDGDYPIIGRQGALCGNINRATGKFYATEHAVCVDTYAGTDVSWACLFLTALNLNQYATATAQPGLAVANINEVLIPLPPLEEQVRIVYKVESSFSVLTAL